LPRPARFRAIDQGEKGAAGARIAYHYIGRVALSVDPTKPTGVVYGYFTDIDGIGAGAPLFQQGTIGENKALFTFLANISVQPLPPNGTVGGIWSNREIFRFSSPPIPTTTGTTPPRSRAASW
jgi:hypothetical protein